MCSIADFDVDFTVFVDFDADFVDFIDFGFHSLEDQRGNIKCFF